MAIKNFRVLISLIPMFLSFYIHSTRFAMNEDLDPSDIIPRLTTAERILFGTWNFPNTQLEFGEDLHLAFVHPLQEKMTSTEMISVDGILYKKLYQRTMIEIDAKERMLNEPLALHTYRQEDINKAINLLQEIKNRLQNNWNKTKQGSEEIVCCCPECPMDILHLLNEAIERLPVLIPQQDVLTCLQFSSRVSLDYEAKTSMWMVYFGDEKLNISCKTIEGLIITHRVLNQAHREGWIRFSEVTDLNKATSFHTGHPLKMNAEAKFFPSFRLARVNKNIKG